jgi:hypothetical protein
VCEVRLCNRCRSETLDLASNKVGGPEIEHKVGLSLARVETTLAELYFSL